KAGVQESTAGFLVAGISPRLSFDDDYQGFLELVGGQISTAISNARAYEQEQKRAQALAELDRAKKIELADTQQLQRISSSLIRENNIHALYDEFLGAARLLMRSDMASIQMLSPERHALFLLAQKGFAPESAVFWQWVASDGASSCGVVLARGESVIVS